MRIAEVDNSGYLRARRVGEMAYKNSVRNVYSNTTVTSDAFTLNAGAGKAVSIPLDTPAGYSFNGIYNVTSNHQFACSIGGFTRNGVTGLCWVDITNRSNTNFTDLVVNMGVSFVKIETE